VLSDEGMAVTQYDDTDVVQMTRSFLADRGQFLRHLFED